MTGKFGKITESHTPVLVDFYATWCGPCQTLAPILEEVKSELGDEISVINIDVDKNKPLATQLQVRGVPTLILYKDGKQLWRKSGLMTKTDLLHSIEPHR